jgi:hypothetical protein
MYAVNLTPADRWIRMIAGERLVGVLCGRVEKQLSAGRRVLPDRKRKHFRRTLLAIQQLKTEYEYWSTELITGLPDANRNIPVAEAEAHLAVSIGMLDDTKTLVEEDLALVVAAPSLKQLCQRALGDRQMLHELKTTMPRDEAIAFTRHLVL